MSKQQTKPTAQADAAPQNSETQNPLNNALSATVETATFDEDQTFESVGNIPFHRFDHSDTAEGIYCGTGKEFDTKFGKMQTHLFFDPESGFFMVKATAALTKVLSQEEHLGAHVYRIKSIGKAKTKAGFECNIFQIQRSKFPVPVPVTAEAIKSVL